jgi:hypothetical protein
MKLTRSDYSKYMKILNILKETKPDMFDMSSDNTNIVARRVFNQHSNNQVVNNDLWANWESWDFMGLEDDVISFAVDMTDILINIATNEHVKTQPNIDLETLNSNPECMDQYNSKIDAVINSIRELMNAVDAYEELSFPQKHSYELISKFNPKEHKAREKVFNKLHIAIRKVVVM